MLSEQQKIFCYYLHGKCGSFHTHLLDAIQKADRDNMNKLRKSFPEFVHIIESYRTDQRYVNDLYFTWNNTCENDALKLK